MDLYEIFLSITLVTTCMPTGISIMMTIFSHETMVFRCREDLVDSSLFAEQDQISRENFFSDIWKTENQNSSNHCSNECNSSYLWTNNIKSRPSQITVYKTYKLTSCDDHLRVKSSQGFIQIGYLFGAFTAGYASDTFGRKPSLIICYIIHTISFLFYIISPSIEVFAIIFLVQLFFQVGQTRAVTVLVSELYPEKYKPLANPLYVTGQACGIVFCSLTAFLLPNWEHQMVVYFLLSVPGFVLINFLPESVVWLECNGQLEKAIFYRKYIDEFRGETVETESMVDKLVATNLNSIENEKNNTEIRILDVFSNKILLKRFTVFSVFTWPATLGIYYLLLWSSPNIGTNPYLNALYMATSDTLACIFTSKIITHGTRKTFLILQTITFTLIILSWIISNSTNLSYFQSILFWLERFSTTATFALVTCWVGEVFPTNLRTVCFGMTTSLSRMVSFCTPFIASWRLSDPQFYWLFQVVLVGMSFVTGGLLLPESKFLREPNGVEDLVEQEKTVVLGRVKNE